MEIFLLEDVPGIGKKNDLLIVGDGYALNCLLPKRAALIATPLVRKRYAEFIKRRAQEREKERAAAAEISAAVSNATLSVTRKASKGGKLYAAVTAKNIADLINEELNVPVSVESVHLDEPIKSVGSFPVSVQIADGNNVTVTVNVAAEKES